MRTLTVNYAKRNFSELLLSAQRKPRVIAHIYDF